jgi:chemotaxis receptor (MCP) glutamine deamidase CheD
MLKEILGQQSLVLKAFDIGGNQSRTLSMEIRTGDVLLKINGAASSF